MDIDSDKIVETPPRGWVDVATLAHEYQIDGHPSFILSTWLRKGWVKDFLVHKTPTRRGRPKLSYLISPIDHARVLTHISTTSNRGKLLRVIKMLDARLRRVEMRLQIDPPPTTHEITYLTLQQYIDKHNLPVSLSLELNTRIQDSCIAVSNEKGTSVLRCEDGDKDRRQLFLPVLKFREDVIAEVLGYWMDGGISYEG